MARPITVAICLGLFALLFTALEIDTAFWICLGALLGMMLMSLTLMSKRK
jgi:hypothetical protein